MTPIIIAEWAVAAFVLCSTVTLFIICLVTLYRLFTGQI
jgi:hypothetical protein